MPGERDFTLRPDQRPHLMMAALGTVAVTGTVVGRIAATLGPAAVEAAEGAVDAVVDDVREQRLRREIARNRPAGSQDGGSRAEAGEPTMDADEIRAQLRDAFDDAREPVPGRLALWRALPDGLDTAFSSNGVTFTARELNERTAGRADFPYATVDDLVDDLIAGMHERGHVA